MKASALLDRHLVRRWTFSVQRSTFASEPEIIIAALLRTVLQNGAFILNEFAQLKTVIYRHPKRLFDINILARLTGPDSRKRVPLIGRCN